MCVIFLDRKTFLYSPLTTYIPDSSKDMWDRDVVQDVEGKLRNRRGS